MASTDSVKTDITSGTASFSDVAIPLTFYGSIPNPSRGVVDVYYSIATANGSKVSLYGFEHVKTKSKVTLHLMKGWTGTLANSDYNYDLGEFSDELLLPDSKSKENNPPYPLSFNSGDRRSRTFLLAPIESMPVGLKATLHQMASIPSGDNLPPEGGSVGPSDSLEAMASRPSPHFQKKVTVAPVINLSLLEPCTGRFRLEIVFFAFLGILCSFAIKNETLGTRTFFLSALLLLGAIFYGPFDENVMMALVAAFIVAGLTWISLFILKKCSLERDCDD